MVGRKSADALRRELGDLYMDNLEGIQGTSVAFADADLIGQMIRDGFEAGEFDVCEGDLQINLSVRLRRVSRRHA